MAGTLLKIGDRSNINLREFCIDTVDEVALLPTTTEPGKGAFADNPAFDSSAPLGSTCIVGNGNDEVLVYMLFSNGWKKL